MRTALLLCLLLAGQVAAQPQFDIVIRGGTVIDGTGGAPYRADVGIVRGHIAALGDLRRAAGATVIDATGLYVTPGFINLHSHAAAVALSHAANMLTQGVTLEILNADGGGPADISVQLSGIAANGMAINAGANAPFNSAWASVVGPADRRPSAEEIRVIRDRLIANLDRGAWGVSAGLDYKPAYYATTEEVIDAVRIARTYRTVFTNHDRVTPESKFSSSAGMAETMVIGERTGLVPLITHMKITGAEKGTAASFLKTMTAATRRGLLTTADAYPYLAGQTGLGALIIPGWAQDGGRARMLERFKDPALRAKIVAETEEAMEARFGGPQSVYLPTLKKRLPEIMKELGVQSGGEAVVRLLEKENLTAILWFGDERDLVKILQHPTTSIACDCGATEPGRSSHPRYYGTYPRVLGRYVRETKALTWADAIRKMTLLPAATIGMVDRGAIAVGMAADIAVFDPARVIDHATFEEPTRPSDGIRHVIVNGVVALRDGAVTGARGGKPLFRTRDMPARAMNQREARRLSVNSHPVTIDITQPAGARRARGIFRFSDQATRTSFETREFGILQTAPGWASFSAIARLMPEGEARPVVVIVDGDRISVAIEGAAPIVHKIR